jgi:hypothetical protein
MKVARKAPTMPRIVVRMKPCGLLGPGARKRATIPATKPITIIQRIFMASSVNWGNQCHRAMAVP